MDGERATRYLASDSRSEILHSAATEITDRYYELAADLVSVVSAQIQIFTVGNFGSVGFYVKNCFLNNCYHE